MCACRHDGGRDTRALRFARTGPGISPRASTGCAAWRDVSAIAATAAQRWQELLDIRGCPAPIAAEATEALAIHHEHRLRDFELARSFALRSLESIKEARRPARTEAVKHRLGRLDRKLNTERTLSF